MAPEFSNGLPPSLIGNPDHAVNVGFKSLQVVSNSIAPLLADIRARGRILQALPVSE